MSDKTKIAYVDATWNPRCVYEHPCKPVSEGCQHCYARRQMPRILAKGIPNTDNLPYQWRRPRRILVPSMGDLFHKDISDDEIFDVFETMNNCSQHTFMFLTKRIDRDIPLVDFTDNIWLGATTENQRRFDERAPELLKYPAQHYWLSLEPLLGPVIIPPDILKKISYVVVGCETGPNARPCNFEWILDIVRQCKRAGVKCFVKQINPYGKILHNPAEWSEEARVRELP